MTHDHWLPLSFIFHGRDHYNLKVTSTAAAKMLNIFPRKGCIAEVIMMIMVVLVMRVVMIDVIMVVKIKKATLR